MKCDFGRLLDNKRLLKILSLVIAILVWLVVVYYIKPDTEKDIRDIPIHITADQSEALSAINLRMVDSEISKVRVRIGGARTVLGGVSAEDVDIRADLTGITAPGTYDVALSGGKTGNFNAGDRYGRGFTLAKTDAINPATVRVRVDRVANKTFAVATDLDVVQTPEDYIRGETKISPKEITISGPETEVSRIDKCVVTAAFSEPLTSSKTLKGQIILYDAEGNKLEHNLLTMSAETADITIPVLKRKDLPVRAEYVNVPPGFPIDRIDDEYSVASIMVAGAEEVVDAYDKIDLGFINLNDITVSGNYFLFDVKNILPNGLTNLSNIQTVIVTVKTEGMLESNFTIPEKNIKPTNIPVNYTVKVESPSINVHIVGDAKAMETLSGNDLIAEIDMSTKDVSPGSYSMPVRVSAPGRGLVWASGEYTALVSIVEK